MRRLAIKSQALAILLVVAVGFLLAGPASSQTLTPPPLDISLVDIEGVITDDASLRATLEISSGAVARDNLRLVTTVFTQATDVSALRSALASDPPSVFGATSTELPDLSPGTTRVLQSTTNTADIALQGPGLAGVYPVQLQVFQGPDPVGSVMTSMIVLPDDPPAPLLAATVIGLRSQAEPLQEDRPAPSLEALLGPDSSLMAFADEVDAIVADGSAAGISLAADGRLLDDLQRLSDGFLGDDGSAVDPTSRIARRAQTAVAAINRLARRGDTEVLAYPYGPADVVALIRNGMTAEALRQVSAGVDTVSQVTGQPTSTDILLPPDGLDARALAALGPVAAEAVLLPRAYLSFADFDRMEPVRRLRTPDGGEVRVLMPDSDLSGLLRAGDDQNRVGVIQQLLAETALQWLSVDQSVDRSTAVLLQFDALDLGEGEPMPAGTLAALTQAVAQAPWLRPVSLSTLRTTVAPSDRLVQLSYPSRSAAAELTPEYLGSLQQARDALGPLSRMLPDDDPSPVTFAGPLEAMSAVAYRDDVSTSSGIARADQVLDRVQQLTDAVQILPSAPVTLTSATGEVPVTVTNTSDVALDVRATVSATRFSFPDATQTITLPPQSTQRLIFQAQALNPGGFAPLLVTLSDPTGSWELATQQLSVRSTAIPIVGVIATLGSVMVLLFWGLKQGRRRPGRHERRHDSAAAA